MKRAGLGGVYMFNCAVGMPDGPARFLQPQWLALMDHTLNETKRLGLQFGVHNCDGFSQSGGPWTTPETFDEATHLDGERSRRPGGR